MKSHLEMGIILIKSSKNTTAPHDDDGTQHTHTHTQQQRVGKNSPQIATIFAVCEVCECFFRRFFTFGFAFASLLLLILLFASCTTYIYGRLLRFIHLLFPRYTCYFIFANSYSILIITSFNCSAPQCFVVIVFDC